MLESYPCMWNAFCLKEYMEMIYRWSAFFSGQDLANLVISTFLSQHTLQSNDPQAVKYTTDLLKKTLARVGNDFVQQTQLLQVFVQAVISKVDQIQAEFVKRPGSDTMMHEILQNLYVVLGSITANPNQKSEQLAQDIATYCLTKLYECLEQAQVQKDWTKVTSIVNQVSEYCRGFPR